MKLADRPHHIRPIRIIVPFVPDFLRVADDALLPVQEPAFA